MKLLISVISFVFFIIVFPVFQSSGQDYLREFHRKMARSPNLEGSLFLLNLCEEKTSDIQEIYKIAFEKFESNMNFSFADLANDTDFTQLCKKNEILITGGPMLGNVTSDGVSVWVRTLVPATVEVKVKNDNEYNIFGPVNSLAESDLTAIVKISGLNSGTKYLYDVIINGEKLNINSETFFVTQPKEDQESTRIVFGSCFHRWGLCNQNLSEQIKERKPLAFLMNGDIAVQDRNNNIALHRADYLLRDFQIAWKDLVANIPVYATWDDHDYFDDDRFNIPKGYTLKDKKAVSNNWRVSWNNPPYGSGEDGEGVYFRTRIGPADVIMLDNRYFREKGNFLGDEQMEWLEEQLLDCTGPFIILSCGTMFSDYVTNGKDSWGVFDSDGREKIFNLIEKHKIGGVLLISGDRHGARGFTIPRPSGFNFYEFGAASLGGRVGPPPIMANWDTQLYGISGEYAFGEFTFNNILPDPEVTFRLIHESGTVFYELKLKRSQLTPK